MGSCRYPNEYEILLEILFKSKKGQEDSKKIVKLSILPKTEQTNLFFFVPTTLQIKKPKKMFVFLEELMA